MTALFEAFEPQGICHGLISIPHTGQLIPEIFEDADSLYSIDKIYLSKPKDNLIIELPNIDSQLEEIEKLLFSIKIFNSTYTLTKIKKHGKKESA